MGSARNPSDLVRDSQPCYILEALEEVLPTDTRKLSSLALFTQSAEPTMTPREFYSAPPPPEVEINTR